MHPMNLLMCPGDASYEPVDVSYKPVNVSYKSVDVSYEPFDVSYMYINRAAKVWLIQCVRFTISAI